MPTEKFSFGVTPKMREVAPGQHAVIKFTAVPTNVETDWGAKLSFPILIFSHPEYQSLSKLGLESTWETKSSCGYQIMSALDIGVERQHEEGYDPKASDRFHKVYLESKWKLTRQDDGTYWIDEI